MICTFVWKPHSGVFLTIRSAGSFRSLQELTGTNSYNASFRVYMLLILCFYLQWNRSYIYKKFCASMVFACVRELNVNKSTSELTDYFILNNQKMPSSTNQGNSFVFQLEYHNDEKYLEKVDRS